MKNSFFSRFTPKEPKFFVFLNQVSELQVSVSQLLKEALHEETVEKRQALFHQIKEKEHTADQVARTIFDALEESFITPFDREDIHDLANGLDDIIDLMNSCAKRLAIYNIKQNNSGACALGDVVVEDALSIKEVISLLPDLRKNSDKIKEKVEYLHALENKADEIYETAITLLFKEEQDGIELIKAKEILSELEKVTDASEKIGKILKTIIVKYA